MAKVIRDDLPTVGVSALRAAHVITPAMSKVTIAFGEGEDALLRTVGVTHRVFPYGGGWSFFACPGCGARVRTLRLYDGRVVCRLCDGLIYRCQAVGYADNSARIARLKALLYSGKKIKRRRALEISLRRALIVDRRKRLEPA